MITTVLIPGIHCSGCGALIQDVSDDFPSIKNATVDLESKKVTLEHDEEFNLQEWKNEIEGLDEKYKVLP